MQCYIFYRREVALKLALNGVICLSMIMCSVYLFKSNLISFIFILLMFAPLLFFKSILRKFRRLVLIQLEKEWFSIIVKSESMEDENNYVFYLNDIKTYKVQFSNRKFVAMRIDLKSNRHFEYSFFRKKQERNQNAGEEIIESIHLLIKRYNLSSETKNKILFRHSFLSSKMGLFCIIGFSCLFALAIVMHIIYHIKSLPFTFIFGLSLLIQLIFKRNADLVFNKKMD